MSNLVYILKEASDVDEVLELASEYADNGYLDEDDIDKLASAYEDGSLDTYFAQQEAADFMLDKIASEDELEKTAFFKKKSLARRIVGGAVKGTAKGVAYSAKGIAKGTKGIAKGITKGTKGLINLLRRRKKTRFERMKDEWNSWSPETRSTIKAGLAATGIGAGGIAFGHAIGKNSGRTQGHNDHLNDK